MQARAGRPVTRDEDVLESTGPGMLTDVYHRSAARDPGIRLLRNCTQRCARCGGISCRFGEFAAHLHAGSWRGVHAAPARDEPEEPRWTWDRAARDALEHVAAT